MPTKTHQDSHPASTSWQTTFRKMHGELTAGERRTGEYFENNLGAAYKSITEVVEDSGIGYGTIIRFCQRMGCRGFQDFKIALARDAAGNASGGDAQADESIGGRLRKDLHETIRLLDTEALEQAAEDILESRVIQIIGVASSAPLVLSLAWKLKRIGLDARPVTEGYIMAVDAFLLTEEDLLIAVSSSGATKDILHTAEVAAERGVSVLAVTNYANSPLSQIADSALYTSASRDPLKAEVPSIIPGEAIFELLLDRLMDLAPDRQEHLVESFKAVSNRKV